jgi:hypothetical protein
MTSGADTPPLPSCSVRRVQNVTPPANSGVLEPAASSASPAAPPAASPACIVRELFQGRRAQNETEERGFGRGGRAKCGATRRRRGGGARA